MRSAARHLEADGDALFGDELILDAIAGDQESESHDTETGNYNGFWLPPRDFERRAANQRALFGSDDAERLRAAREAGVRFLVVDDSMESLTASERDALSRSPVLEVRFRNAVATIYEISRR